MLLWNMSTNNAKCRSLLSWQPSVSPADHSPVTAASLLHIIYIAAMVVISIFCRPFTSCHSSHCVCSYVLLGIFTPSPCIFVGKYNAWQCNACQQLWQFKKVQKRVYVSNCWSEWKWRGIQCVNTLIALDTAWSVPQATAITTVKHVTGTHLGNGRWNNGTVPYRHFRCPMSLTARLRWCGRRWRDSHLGLLHDNRLRRCWGHATSRHNLQHVPHLKHLCAPTPSRIWHREVLTGDYLQHVQYRTVSSLFHLL
jgi:hypothetical protein